MTNEDGLCSALVQVNCTTQYVSHTAGPSFLTLCAAHCCTDVMWLLHCGVLYYTKSLSRTVYWHSAVLQFLIACHDTLAHLRAVHCRLVCFDAYS